MKPRLDAHYAWEERRKSNPNEPYPDNALAPSEVVNEQLGKLVDVCNREYSSAEQKEIRRLLSEIEPDLQDISNLSEHQMERVSLNYIFSVYENREIPKLKLNASTQEKIAHLERLINEIPRQENLEDVPPHERFSFPYLANYVVMAENELRLITDDNKVPDLTDKTIAFVGAGFPLSAIMYHLLSGAEIVLVDYDQGACDRAQAFLEICHKAGILDKNKFKIIKADAAEAKYSKAKTKEQSSQTGDSQAGSASGTESENQVNADYLVFAAALPSAIKAQALERVKAGDITVLNRATSEMNNLLYPKTKIGSLKKNNGLGKTSGRDFNVVQTIYPIFTLKNKVEKEKQKDEKPPIPTDEINQNTAERVEISVEKEDKSETT
ncbi:hypothetical protein TRICHSKD4_2981 [Roseibium sp. TrichSKD4]|nr:hypothetical protein TRICHSKD4_2981 [Roseibium sp. TrichSKD4]